MPAMTTRRYLIAPFLLCGLVLVGCDRDSDSNSPSPGNPSGGAITVRGTERIAWSQEGEGSTAYTFVALVDQSPRQLSDTRCLPSGSAFDCSAPLPTMSVGAHTLQLIAVNAQGAQSPPSNALTLNVVRQTAQDAPSSDTNVRCAECPGGVDVLVDGLGRIEQLAALPDGGVLLLQDGQQILLLNQGRLSEAMRVESVNGRATRLVDLDVDPNFANSGFVFALTQTIDRSGRHLTSVVRMRASGDFLGEQSTIVPEFPYTSKTPPILSIGPDGLLYVSVPGGQTGRASYDAMLLRFTFEGGSAGNAAAVSPLLARSLAQPGALTWDDGKRLWMSGTNVVGGRAEFLLLSPQVPQRTWPAIPQQVEASQALAKASLVRALVFPSLGARPSGFVIAGDPGVLYSAELSSSTLPVLNAIGAFPISGVDLKALAVSIHDELLLAGTVAGSENSVLLRVRHPESLLSSGSTPVGR